MSYFREEIVNYPHRGFFPLKEMRVFSFILGKRAKDYKIPMKRRIINVTIKFLLIIDFRI